MKLKAHGFLRPLRPIIEKSGADYAQVALLVDLKLLLDNRNTQINSSGKAKDPRNSLVRQSVMFLIVGTFMGLMISKSQDIFSFGLIANTYLMVMLTISMLSEYSVSLFDTRDNHLILPLPVNGITLGWARVLHILLYLLLFFISIALPIYIFAGLQFGFTSFVLFFVSGLFNTFFTLFFTIFVYMGLTRLMNGEKLKDVLMYIQVGFSLLIMIGYQFISNNLFEKGLADPSLFEKWYFLLVPPAWFTYLPGLTLMHTPVHLLGSALSILIPIASAWLISKKIFKGFEVTLSDLNASGAKNNRRHKQKEQGNSIWFQMVRYIMGVSRSELPLYQLMWKMIGRERIFKQGILPMLGYTILLPLIMLFTTKSMDGGKTQYQIYMYFTIMISSTLPAMMPTGNNSGTGWIYQTLPHLPAHRLFTATLKAAFGRFFFPVFLIMSAPLFYFKGWLAFPGLLTLFVYNYSVSMLILLFQPPIFPFSQIKSASQGGKTMIRMFVVIFFAIPFGFLHFWLSTRNEWLVLLPVLILLPLIILIQKRLLVKKYTWKTVELVNQPG